METIKKALEIFGSCARMAQELEISEYSIKKYLTCDRFPSAKVAHKIEQKTNGEVKSIDILIEKIKTKHALDLKKKSLSS